MVLMQSSLAPSIMEGAPLSAKGPVIDGSPLQCVFPDLTFAIVKNTSDNYASLCVKTTRLDEAVPVLFSMEAFYNLSVQDVTMAVIVTNDWMTIDNDLGYSDGGMHVCRLLNKDNLDMYRIEAMTTNTGSSGHADIAAIVAAKVT